MGEGSLEAPVRHAIPWNTESFNDPGSIDIELRRVFDICHGCRRCFNLCGSFPKLFDLIDESDTGELDSVESAHFKSVVDACTLCDMCYMTKCPYVPPHEFNIDFPHLMLRYRSMEFSQGKVANSHMQLVKTDRNGVLGCLVGPLVNWMSDYKNFLFRKILGFIFDIDPKAALPRYFFKRFDKYKNPGFNSSAPGSGRKVVLYATCFVNYNDPSIGDAAQKVLAANGVETKTIYPNCCGMPQLEQGNIENVARSAKKVAAELVPWVDSGYDIIALVPSCALMLKSEWPLILPGDKEILKLSDATFDLSEYLVNLSKKEGLLSGMKPIEGGITIHLACHSRAQNMGPKAAELLRLIPDTEISVIERCSGHGGSWGVMKTNFESALKSGKPVASRVAESGDPYILSECPLAREHIIQGVEKLRGANGINGLKDSTHPIQILAKSYNLI